MPSLCSERAAVPWRCTISLNGNACLPPSNPSKLLFLVCYLCATCCADLSTIKVFFIGHILNILNSLSFKNQLNTFTYLLVLKYLQWLHPHLPSVPLFTHSTCSLALSKEANRNGSRAMCRSSCAKLIQCNWLHITLAKSLIRVPVKSCQVMGSHRDQ